VGTILFPLSLNHFDFRSVFSQGVSVSAYKSSPAYAALQDIRQSYSDETKFPEPHQTLSSGTPYRFQAVQAAPVQRHLVMRGLTIRTPARPEPLPEARPQPVLVARDAVKKQNHVPTRLQAAAREHDDEVGSISTMPGMSALMASQSESENRNAESTAPDIFVVSPAKDGQRPLWLHGQIEMTGGLAFVGPGTHLLVKRVVDGQALEKGRIWVTEGKFEIHVDKALGFLVAELVNRNGQVLGRGEINLLGLQDIPLRDNQIRDLRIALRPANDAVALRTLPAYSSGPNPTLSASRVEIQDHAPARATNDEGYLTDSTLDKSSTFVARATAHKHWSTIVVGQAGYQQDIRLFSNNLIEALINISLNGTDKREAFHAGVVWGQVSRTGEPVAGAQVEMAGDYRPIYFNEAYLPDPQLSSTSKNGLFAFLRVKPGVQAVRVRWSDKLYPAQVFPAENRHVSYVEMELRDHVISQIKMIDPLDNDRPVESHIKLVGTDSVLKLSGDNYVDYSTAANTFMVEAQAGQDYEISRTVLTGTPQRAFLPMVRRDWLRGFFEQLQINAQPGRGQVVGFVDQYDFEVEITGLSQQDQTKIIYFDRYGKLVPGNMGVSGGGFIILNAPLGLQTVYIRPVRSKVGFSQVVVAEPDYVHVMAW